MRTKKNAFFCFVALVLFSFLSTIASASEGSIDRLLKSSLGTASKESEVYDDLTHFMIANIQENQISNNFKNYCQDRDFQDSVDWSQIESSTTDSPEAKFHVLTFNCLEDYEVSLQDEASQREKNGYIFLATVDFKNQKILNLSSTKVQLDQQEFMKSHTILFVVKESVTIGLSVATTAAVISKMFPGEKDKQLHGRYMSALTAGLTSLAYHFLKLPPKKSFLLALGLTMTAGAIREITGNKDMRDMKANLVGGLIGGVFSLGSIKIEKNFL